MRFGFDSVPDTFAVYRAGRTPGVMSGAKPEQKKLNSHFQTSDHLFSQHLEFISFTWPQVPLPPI